MARIRGLIRAYRIELAYGFVLACALFAGAARAEITCNPGASTGWCIYGSSCFSTLEAAKNADSGGNWQNARGNAVWMLMGGAPHGPAYYGYRMERGNAYLQAPDNTYTVTWTGTYSYFYPTPNTGMTATEPTCGPSNTECGAKPDTLSSFGFRNGSLTCMGSCLYTAVNDYSGAETLLTPFDPTGSDTGQSCTSSTSFTCPSGYTTITAGQQGYLGQQCMLNEGDADADGIPNSTDPKPFVPGDAPDTDGDGTPDATDAFPNDPDNGKKAEDGTTPSKNTSVGGGSCSDPPVSKGDAIAAQVAFQTWKTRCAAERTASLLADGIEVTGGSSSSSSGLTTGQAADLASIKNNTATTASNTGAGAAAAAAINGKLADDESEGGDVTGTGSEGSAAGHGENTEYGTSGLDTTGMGAGNTCPTMGTLTVLGVSMTPDTSLMCDWATVIGQLVLVFAALGCLRILGGAA